MIMSFSMEYTERPGVVRGFIWKTTTHGYRPVTLIHDIAEGSDIDILHWFTEKYPAVGKVRLPDGTLEEPDCLTTFEAAEAAMVPI